MKEMEMKKLGARVLRLLDLIGRTESILEASMQEKDELLTKQYQRQKFMLLNELNEIISSHGLTVKIDDFGLSKRIVPKAA